jgi:hypothetical protein
MHLPYSVRRGGKVKELFPFSMIYTMYRGTYSETAKNNVSCPKSCMARAQVRVLKFCPTPPGRVCILLVGSIISSTYTFATKNTYSHAHTLKNLNINALTLFTTVAELCLTWSKQYVASVNLFL